MANNYFRFKQFTIFQNHAAMRVNTDGVLLGAWANVDNASRMLDIGTGTGVIALMLAQRTHNVKIDAIEIDEHSANEARRNVALSSWSERIDVIHCSLQSFAQSVSSRYDLIVSNPPYFNQSLKSPLERKNLVRHTDLLPYHDLISGISVLLTENGRFCGVFPYTEGNVFIAQASTCGLFCTQRINVYSQPGKGVIRLLLQFERVKKTIAEHSLTIHNPDGSFSEHYRQLTADFYLAF